MIDYDAWLEEPYQDECDAQDAYDEAEERYRESDPYYEHLAEWQADNQGKTETDWVESDDYVKSVEYYQQIKAGNY